MSPSATAETGASWPTWTLHAPGAVLLGMLQKARLGVRGFWAVSECTSVLCCPCPSVLFGFPEPLGLGAELSPVPRSWAEGGQPAGLQPGDGWAVMHLLVSPPVLSALSPWCHEGH